MSLIHPQIILPLTAATLASNFQTDVESALFAMRWALVLIVVLVITDFWSGLTASVRIRKEKFRKSRAIRRTLTKFCEYLSYMIIGVVVYKSCVEPFGLGTPTHGAAIASILVVYCEADSIYEHICDMHGMKKKISLKDIIISYIKRKNRDVGEAVEETLNKEDNEQDN